MEDKQRYYLDKDEFLQSMIESQEKGVPTDRYAEGCMMIGQHMLTSRQFRGYSEHLKEDMLSNAMLCCMKAIHKFNTSKTSNAFGYITRTIWTAFVMVLRQHYRYLNFKKKIMEDTLTQMDDLTAKRTLKMWQDGKWMEDDRND